MQYDRNDKGHLTSLPKPSIDTGMGLERIAAVLQGKISKFETDLLRPIMERASQLLATRVGESSGSDISLQIIADHVKASTFLISDGILPANEGRGYVLRKSCAAEFVRELCSDSKAHSSMNSPPLLPTL